MDFMMRLPKTRRKNDTVWVIVDQLTKSANFLPIRVNLPLSQMAELYVSEIVRLHGIPVSIVSDWDTRFTLRFWKALQEAFGTVLNYNIAFHPQTDGQTKRTIQTLKDLLRACALDKHTRKTVGRSTYL